MGSAAVALGFSIELGGGYMHTASPYKGVPSGGPGPGLRNISAKKLHHMRVKFNGLCMQVFAGASDECYNVL